jgi:hypothetical protein
MKGRSSMSKAAMMIASVVFTLVSAASIVASHAQESTPPGQARSQTSQRPTSTTALTGAPVTFRYGANMSPGDMEGMVIVVTRRGCPVERATADGPPGRIYVRTNGEVASFTDADSAAGWALDNCLTR